MSALLLAMLLSQNYQPYPVAPRAAGMGGAASALGEGSGNTFYNPAALAFSTSTSVEVSGNVFGIDGSTTQGDIGDGSSHTRFGFAIIPANLSLETHGLKFGPFVLSDKWGIGVSLLAPFNFSLNSVTTSVDKGTVVFRDTNELVYTIYNNLAYRISDELGLGFSVVAVYRRFDTSANSIRDSADAYQSFTYQREESTLGHTLAFGFRWKPALGLRLGAGARLPLQNVYGSGDDRLRESTFNRTTGVLTSQSYDRPLDVKYEQPWRFHLGAAWEVANTWALAAELVFYTPYTYAQLRHSETGETLATTRLQAVVNVAVGAEIFLGSHPLRFGFFTDRSPLGEPTPDDAIPERIDRYGGTLSIGFQRALFQTELGVLFAAGKLRALGYDTTGGTFSPLVADGFQWRAMLTLSSTLRY